MGVPQAVADAAIRGEFAYDPDTGILTRRDTGLPTGSINKGYVQVFCRGRFYRGHRVCWFLAKGGWPVGPLDHINGNKADNRLSNLRIATVAQNAWNARSHGRFKKGVTMHRSGKFQARISVDGRERYLGLFDTEDEAHAAYCDVAHRSRGEFARVS